MEPAAHGRPEHERDGRAGRCATEHAEAQLKAALPGIEPVLGMDAVVIEVDQHVADPAGHHCARDDAQQDEEQVVAPEVPRSPFAAAHLRVGLVDGRHPPRDERGEAHGKDDRHREGEGLPAHDEIAEAEDRVKIEGDQSQRHSARSVSRAGSGEHPSVRFAVSPAERRLLT